jgi:anti-sigma factor RsiW
MDLLLSRASGKLDAVAAAVLEDHIGRCPACREFARGQRAVSEALDAWEAAPVSLDFDRRLYHRIENEVSRWDLLLRPFRPVTFRRGLPAAAAAGLAIAAGLLLERPAAPPVSLSPDSAQVEALQPEQVEHALDEMEMLSEFGHRLHAADSDSRI